MAPSWTLLGVDETTLKAMRKDIKVTEYCIRTMLFTWAKLKVPAWHRVVCALLEMGEKVLAERIAKKYSKFTVVFICVS